MALIAAHLNAGVILVVTVQRYVYKVDLGPRYYLLGDSSALNKFNQPKSSQKCTQISLHIQIIQ